MCGIFGMRSTPGSVLPNIIQESVKMMYHRGPDAQTHWINKQSSVGLGHARLSIIDLSSGSQPIASEDGHLQTVVNGEFYDYEKIRAELKSKGHRFRSNSDSEILVHLYEEHGVECLKYLRGEFAFILWDERNQLLFAGRDRFGIKPLFYSVTDESIYLSSEIKGLAAAGVATAWDLTMVNQLAFCGSESPGRTLFRGIYQIPPGHVLLHNGGPVSIKKYWDFDFPIAANQSAKGDETALIEEFKLRFEEAVKIRLRADVPVAFALSGGIDSSSVVGVASKFLNNCDVFTLTFADQRYDERSEASEMARSIGAKVHDVAVTSEKLVDTFAAAVWHSETIFRNGHRPAKFILNRAIRDAGFKVVLNGEGADEVLAGYVPYRRDMILNDLSGLDPSEVENRIAQLTKQNQRSRGLTLAQGTGQTIATLKRLLGYVPSFYEAQLSYGKDFRRFMSDDFISSVSQRDEHLLMLADLDVTSQLSGRHILNQSLYLYAKGVLPNYILVGADRMEMASSVEGRVPFLDHPLVDFISTLPVSLKIREETEKYILREAAKDWVTAEAKKRKKTAFHVPPAITRPGDPFYIYAQDMLRSANAKGVPFFESKKIVQFLDLLPKMDEDSRGAFDALLVTALSVCHLQEAFGLSAESTRPLHLKAV